MAKEKPGKPATKVALAREIRIPGFQDTWGLTRVGDGRKEAGGFKSAAEAEEWAPRWGCEIVKRENSMPNGVERGAARYGARR